MYADFNVDSPNFVQLLDWFGAVLLFYHSFWHNLMKDMFLLFECKSPYQNILRILIRVRIVRIFNSNEELWYLNIRKKDDIWHYVFALKLLIFQTLRIQEFRTVGWMICEVKMRKSRDSEPDLSNRLSLWLSSFTHLQTHTQIQRRDSLIRCLLASTFRVYSKFPLISVQSYHRWSTVRFSTGAFDICLKPQGQ